MPTVLERVRKNIVRELGVEERDVVPESVFEGELVDQEDPLALVKLVMALEKEFSQDGQPIEIHDEDLEGLRTVQDMVDHLIGLGIKDN